MTRGQVIIRAGVACDHAHRLVAGSTMPVSAEADHGTTPRRGTRQWLPRPRVPCLQAQAHLRFPVRVSHSFLMGGAQRLPQLAVLATQLTDKMLQQANPLDEVAH